MTRIRSGKEALHAITPAGGIDWNAVLGLQVWSVPEDRPTRLEAPGGLDIRWMKAVGVRYAVVAVFTDDTWTWVDRLADLEDAKAAVHRLAAEHDKPVHAGAQSDDELRAGGY